MRLKNRMKVNLRHLRIALGYSQRELGLKIGASDKTICAYESGAVIPPLDRLQMLADALFVNLFDLAYTKMSQKQFDRALLAQRIAGIKRLVEELPIDKIE